MGAPALHRLAAAVRHGGVRGPYDSNTRRCVDREDHRPADSGSQHRHPWRLLAPRTRLPARYLLLFPRPPIGQTHPLAGLGVRVRSHCHRSRRRVDPRPGRAMGVAGARRGGTGWRHRTGMVCRTGVEIQPRPRIPADRPIHGLARLRDGRHLPLGPLDPKPTRPTGWSPCSLSHRAFWRCGCWPTSIRPASCP